jgi:hypothetical protein
MRLGILLPHRAVVLQSARRPPIETCRQPLAVASNHLAWRSRLRGQAEPTHLGPVWVRHAPSRREQVGGRVDPLCRGVGVMDLRSLLDTMNLNCRVMRWRGPKMQRKQNGQLPV